MTAKGGPRNVNWLAVRTYYFSAASITYKQCSEKFGVSTRSIENRASNEDWKKERKRIFGQAEEQLRQTATDDARRGLSLHADLADELVAAVKAGLAELSDMNPGRNKAETLKTLAETADKAVRLSREVRGIRAGESSTGDDSGGDAYEYEWIEAPRPLEAQA